MRQSTETCRSFNGGSGNREASTPFGSETVIEPRWSRFLCLDPLEVSKSLPFLVTKSCARRRHRIYSIEPETPEVVR